MNGPIEQSEIWTMPLAVRKLADSAASRRPTSASIRGEASLTIQSIMRSALAESSPPDLRWQNPKRRKNIMSSAAGSYDDYGSYSFSAILQERSEPRIQRRYTLASFSKKYWGQGYEEVDRTTRMAFWDDFKYCVHWWFWVGTKKKRGDNEDQGVCSNVQRHFDLPRLPAFIAVLEHRGFGQQSCPLDELRRGH